MEMKSENSINKEDIKILNSTQHNKIGEEAYKNLTIEEKFILQKEFYNKVEKKPKKMKITMIYNNTVYISMSEMTMGDFLKIAEKKLEKKINNIKKLDKYDLHPSESNIYPNSKECEYKQIV